MLLSLCVLNFCMLSGRRTKQSQIALRHLSQARAPPKSPPTATTATSRLPSASRTASASSSTYLTSPGGGRVVGGNWWRRDYGAIGETGAIGRLCSDRGRLWCDGETM
jgi:hypothetical protein